MHSDWGIIEDFSLSADTKTALTLALEILVLYHTKVESFDIGINNEGIPQLTLYWTEDAGKNKFMMPVFKSDIIGDMVFEWAKSECDALVVNQYFDGSTHDGFHITNIRSDDYTHPRSPYEICRVYPRHIYYGK